MTTQEELVAQATSLARCSCGGASDAAPTCGGAWSESRSPAAHVHGITGVSPRAYLAARRLESAKSRLREGADVTRALHAAGYGSSSRFYDQARSSLGMTPTSYKRGGEGMTMSFATADSPIGRVLVAADRAWNLRGQYR